MQWLLKVYVSDNDFHQNVRAKQVVVPKWSSGFLENSLNSDSKKMVLLCIDFVLFYCFYLI